MKFIFRKLTVLFIDGLSIIEMIGINIELIKPPSILAQHAYVMVKVRSTGQETSTFEGGNTSVAVITMLNHGSSWVRIPHHAECWLVKVDGSSLVFNGCINNGE